MFSTKFLQNFLLPRPQAARRPLPSAVRGQRCPHTRLSALAARVGCETGTGRRRAWQSRADETPSSDSLASLLRALLSARLWPPRLHLNATSSLIRLICILGCLHSSHPSKSISRSTLHSLRSSRLSASHISSPSVLLTPPWRLVGDGRATRCSTIPCACSREHQSEDRQW